jgi:predicted permease
MNGLSNEYWKTMGVPLLEGRDFNDHDSGKKLTVAIVNRKFATHFFGEKSAVGRHIGFGQGPKSKLDMEIVGVTEDSLYEGPREGVHRQVFVPFSQSDYPAGVAFYVRTSMDSRSMFAALRRKVQELDSTMPVYQMKTVEHQLDETLSTERMIATLSAAFGILATALAAIGLYGVMAFVVARRTRELGLRMALGAPRGVVVWMVMRETIVLVAAGLAIGVPTALLVSRYVSTQLFGVKPTDIGAAAAALGILAVVAAGAGFVPARRASTIDPIQALRYE